MACVLCSIAADVAHPHRLLEDDETVTILNNGPAVAGHLMVLPRRHVADAWACDVALYQAVYGAVHRAASLLHDRLGAEGVTVVEAVREPGWQSIPHLHSHVLPRWGDDDLQPLWEARLEASDADFETMRRRLLAGA